MTNDNILPETPAPQLIHQPSEPTFTWPLTQERLEMVFYALHKLEALLNTAIPGTLSAENVARLMTDLRVQCCLKGGAADPLPYRPLWPRFAGTDAGLCPEEIWPADQELEGPSC